MQGGTNGGGGIDIKSAPYSAGSRPDAITEAPEIASASSSAYTIHTPIIRVALRVLSTRPVSPALASAHLTANRILCMSTAHFAA
jgi:hypothetical protein